MSDDGRIEIACRDATGRPRALSVSLVDGEVCLTIPTPAACFGWRELDQLQRVLAEKRAQMPGAAT
ncbi:hypothetical protein SK571_13440 [Lentzea sp. BCCO 10_0798]|uniref:Uncharacterized protein n=1 Tax=Lentzea kristufekii TaxID=3095430 RepID=A0ABU4TQ23_9PSEU|nr:hypothetical protein [Lentzea sp. BCCO 10_0798]MDX8050389.1 hypothetical protein [Lentzea sp. BCCO 10_0798]